MLPAGICSRLLQNPAKSGFGGAMERPGAVLDTDDVINGSRIGRLQIMVGVLAALILVVNGYNVQVISYVAPQIARDWSIPREVLGWILAADKFGLMAGYLIVSPMSGYFGHKRVAIEI